MSANRQGLKIRLLRHATLVIEIGSRRLLVDPMLCAQNALDPIQQAADTRRIPLVNLPLDDAELIQLLATVDAVLVTHTHRDHWDIAAQTMLAPDKLIFCQAASLKTIQGQGFTNAHAIAGTHHWEGITITRTGGQHGTGKIGQQMGIVSGFVLKHDQECVYIAGDTIWCAEVATALAQHRPPLIVLNTGAAEFLQGGPITMTAGDVQQVALAAPQAKLIAVHLDTVNHCLLTRPLLKAFLLQQHLVQQCLVPDDGEELQF
jgi:L-ascorbate metabolism protein UlaG (beta-lactamase superfamily)